MASALLCPGLIVICDSNVWIDLEHGGIRRKVFKAGLTFAVPDYLFSELEWPDGDMLVQLGLQVLELPPGGVRRVQQLQRQYPKPGTADLFALVSAEIEGATLLTRDGDLRAAASAEGVRVGDTLDLVGYLVAQGALSPQQAIDALHEMQAAGRGLPIARTRQLIRRLERIGGIP